MLTTATRPKHYQTCLCKRLASLWRKSGFPENEVLTPMSTRRHCRFRSRQTRTSVTPRTPIGQPESHLDVSLPAPAEFRLDQNPLGHLRARPLTSTGPGASSDPKTPPYARGDSTNNPHTLDPGLKPDTCSSERGETRPRRAR